MKRLTLIRDLPTSKETQGWLTAAELKFATIERPWIPTSPGGKPEESCVPAGLYKLESHSRPNGDKVVALVNHGLGVYHYPSGVGRSLILIHSGNWVTDVIGCIAPGLERGDNPMLPMVKRSKEAMQVIMGYIGDGPAELLIIGENSYE
jgi:hypothetical protein